VLSKICFCAILLFCLSVALDHRAVILAQATARSEIAAPRDIDTLIRECICKGSGKVITEYTYTWEIIRRGADRLGQIHRWSEIYEVYVPPIREGRLTEQFPILISRNGRELPTEAITKARLRAGEKLQEAERAGNGHKAKTPSSDRPARARRPWAPISRWCLKARAAGARLSSRPSLFSALQSFTLRGQVFSTARK